MKLPFLASLILFILVLIHRIKRQDHIAQKENTSFWEREAKANATRRKSLDQLDYIEIPFDCLPTDLLAADPQVSECIALIRSLSTQKIVNLTGYTNTDLKLAYGAPNITELSEYDTNYTILVRTLQQWADVLLEKGYPAEATQIMAFAIHTHTDISRTYYQMANYLREQGDLTQIEALVTVAKSLRSANRNAIVRTLEQDYIQS